VALTFCWNIRFALVPLFGPDFPSICIPPDQEGFQSFNANPSTVASWNEEVNRWIERAKTTATRRGEPNAQIFPSQTAPGPSNSITRHPSDDSEESRLDNRSNVEQGPVKANLRRRVALQPSLRPESRDGRNTQTAVASLEQPRRMPMGEFGGQNYGYAYHGHHPYYYSGGPEAAMAPQRPLPNPQLRYDPYSAEHQHTPMTALPSQHRANAEGHWPQTPSPTRTYQGSSQWNTPVSFGNRSLHAVSSLRSASSLPPQYISPLGFASNIPPDDMEAAEILLAMWRGTRIYPRIEYALVSARSAADEQLPLPQDMEAGATFQRAHGAANLATVPAEQRILSGPHRFRLLPMAATVESHGQQHDIQGSSRQITSSLHYTQEINLPSLHEVMRGSTSILQYQSPPSDALLQTALNDRHRKRPVRATGKGPAAKRLRPAPSRNPSPEESRPVLQVSAAATPQIPTARAQSQPAPEQAGLAEENIEETEDDPKTRTWSQSVKPPLTSAVSISAGVPVSDTAT
jgi:hypothetical protein